MKPIYQKEQDEQNLTRYNLTSDLYGKLMKDEHELKKVFKKWKHFDWELPGEEGWYICMVFENEELKEIPLYFVPSDDDLDGHGKWFRTDTDDKEEYFDYLQKDQPWYNRIMMFMWRPLPQKWNISISDFISKYMDIDTTINF